LAIDGAVVAAATEDSFVRLSEIGYRYTGGYPLSSIAACLEKAGLTLQDVDHIAVVSGDESHPRFAAWPDVGGIGPEATNARDSDRRCGSELRLAWLRRSLTPVNWRLHISASRSSWCCRWSGWPSRHSTSVDPSSRQHPFLQA
jgi:hypothetical protein